MHGLSKVATIFKLRDNVSNDPLYVCIAPDNFPVIRFSITSILLAGFLIYDSSDAEHISKKLTEYLHGTNQHLEDGLVEVVPDFHDSIWKATARMLQFEGAEYSVYENDGESGFVAISTKSFDHAYAAINSFQSPPPPKITFKLNDNTQSVAELWNSIAVLAQGRVNDNAKSDDYPLDVREGQLHSLEVLVYALKHSHINMRSTQ